MCIQYSLLMCFVLLLAAGVSMAADMPTAELKVYDKTLHEIDVRLFGQFLERASFGDHGPEAFVDPETGKLPTQFVEMLKAMEIPIIRFPGGTDVDYIDWREMIDNVPGRDGGRPLTKSYRPGREQPHTISNYFGYDEYFALRDELGCQTIIVVNVLDGLAKRRPVEEAAELAGGLVAYINTPVGAKLPEGMVDWPSVRAKNGHKEPFGAEFVQIGNEAFVTMFKNQVYEAVGSEKAEDLAPWYLEVYTAYIKAIRAVDPDVKIIMDAWLGEGISNVVFSDPYIKENIAYVARHRYAPGGCDEVKRGGERIDASTVTEDQYWWAWASMPGANDEAGQNQAFGPRIMEDVSSQYPVACTEWNWNGWRWQGMIEKFEAPAAAGLGAAGFIQGMMRQGDEIKIATQSMLVGRGWSFAAILGDPSGEYPPFYTPQGSSTTFYRKNHGSQMLQVELKGVVTHPQPYYFGWGGGVDHEVAELDVMATADDEYVYVHAINRNFDKDVPLKIDLSKFGKVGSEGTHLQLTFKLFGEPGHGVGRGVAQHGEKALEVSEVMTVMMPARTVSILKIPRG